VILGDRDGICRGVTNICATTWQHRARHRRSTGTAAGAEYAPKHRLSNNERWSATEKRGHTVAVAHAMPIEPTHAMSSILHARAYYTQRRIQSGEALYHLGSTPVAALGHGMCVHANPAGELVEDSKSIPSTHTTKHTQTNNRNHQGDFLTRPAKDCRRIRPCTQATHTLKHRPFFFTHTQQLTPLTLSNEPGPPT
jgi:hypothetical protein